MYTIYNTLRYRSNFYGTVHVFNCRISIYNNNMTTCLEQIVGNVQDDNNNTMLHVFLNEKCKDAMHIMDFIKSITLSYDDFLLLYKNYGYFKAMTDIIVSNLNKLPLTQRPMHCTSISQQTIYVKHNNEWHHEDKTAPIMIMAVNELKSQFWDLLDHLNAIDDNAIENDKYGLVRKLAHDLASQREHKIITLVCKQTKVTNKHMLTA